MILSIGMIVKNEEKTLRKCLESLKPILANIKSELIIYDTGSTDSTIEIAREFTDNVFEIEWRGDFAWARNHTIRRARGKWFMYLDADEIFLDTSDLVNFFNSGEYRKYNSASYGLKNFKSGGKFSYFNVNRLYKLEKDTVFRDKIHEYITPVAPIKSIKSLAEHHGYKLDDIQTRFSKHERNIKPLLEMYEEEFPKSLRTINHIIDSYGSVDDLIKTREFLISYRTSKTKPTK